MHSDMTTGPARRTILLFSLPIMGASLLQVLYNLVDSIIVGNFVSSSALGAVGLTAPMAWLLGAVGTGLGSGTCIAISQYFGARRQREMREVITAAYLLAAAAGIAVTLLCALTAKPLIWGFMKTPAAMRQNSLGYYLVYCGGLIFQLLYNVTYGALRAYGNSKGALLFLLISAVLNVALDCLFVIALHWGVVGAAAATVISQAGSAVASILYLRRLFPDLLPGRLFLRSWRRRSWQLTRLSVPIMFQGMVSSMGFIVLQRLVNSFGTASIEGFSALQRIEQLAHIPSESFSAAMASFVGQNIGAGQVDRAKKGYRVTVQMGVCISAVLAVLIILLDRRLLCMFGISGQALLRGKEHLDLLMLFIWVSTISTITCGFLQGAGDVKVPAASGFISLGIRLALSFALAGTAVGFRCYYVSMPPAWVIACLFVVWRYRSGRWKRFKIT
ncbi:MATE family efflux transporter [Neobittarella massiliensis]|uniref:Probable multidrug resistance protein NorM n=2 Tax=Oscillospiraceae TaxID=216572 RepID=A0A8J6LZ37_9FIRM|nr:MATE family efflux transporter [Neobittarella massiliensis]MBC3516213.1 MATE family efflux transporter [Neobittarella massiliensis]SCJ86062.1 Staphylococcal virulence regulator protein A [uncultured Anaerotruncus sp.]